MRIPHSPALEFFLQWRELTGLPVVVFSQVANAVSVKGIYKQIPGCFNFLRKKLFFKTYWDQDLSPCLTVHPETFLLQLGIMNLSETSSGRICTMSTYSWIFAGFTQRCWKKKINQNKSWKKKINQNKRFEKSLLIVSLGMFRPNKICNCYILLQISLTSKVTKYP